MIDQNLAPLARLRSFMFYAICGGSGVLFDFCLFALLTHFEVNYQLANACGYLGGTLLSFVLNRRFTFQVLDDPYGRLFKFLSVAMIGFLTSWALIIALVENLSIPPLMAKAIVLIVVVVLQFTLNSIWTFKLRRGFNGE